MRAPSTWTAARAPSAPTEAAAIAEIWHRVAEDYAAFDIDVTTEEPASFGPTVGRVLITAQDRRQRQGDALQHRRRRGLCGRLRLLELRHLLLPALVYFENLAKGTTYIAEACAHEFGHNLGLSHDGTGSTTYYAGHGSGYTSWAPIMGNSYYNNVTQWSKGEYTRRQQHPGRRGHHRLQARLRRRRPRRLAATATPLLVSANGEILVSTPQTDQDNLYPENKGVIERRGDKDVFSVDVDAGPLRADRHPGLGRLLPDLQARRQPGPARRADQQPGDQDRRVGPQPPTPMRRSAPRWPPVSTTWR